MFEAKDVENFGCHRVDHVDCWNYTHCNCLDNDTIHICELWNSAKAE